MVSMDLRFPSSPIQLPAIALYVEKDLLEMEPFRKSVSDQHFLWPSTPCSGIWESRHINLTAGFIVPCAKWILASKVKSEV